MKSFGWFIFILIVLLVLLDSCSTGILPPIFILAGYALFGWIGLVGRMGHLVSWQWEMFWTVLIYAALLLSGGHLFARWLYLEMRKSSDATHSPRWKLGWSFRFFALLIFVFSAGTSCIAIVHQSTWLATSPKSMFIHSPRATRVKCSSNLRQIGQGIELYAHDHQGRFPDDMQQLIIDVDINSEVLICPGSDLEKATGATTQAIVEHARKPEHCSYIYLGKGLTLPVDPDRIIAHDRLDNHDEDGINILFGDLHVEWCDQKTAIELLNKPPPTTRAAEVKP